ncbi:MULTISPECIES: LysE family translocator [unclassified Acinetobacter]|uniref:LysE family translocator n=1 Tax=unclassified Acinetobacter TaxID=196816 RepID=UPI002578B60A|nr:MULTISPECIES: LysE family translocator [unclassified Acinetobacter]MDM1763237.1 LysE family translocator [Acinetobacter sp. 226-1]MDM1766716.1 LysE family translocator [Acinetobacter sp. 226-4]
MFIFSLSMSISPGPVNLTILSSSMNYGAKRTFAFISGATIGFTALLAAVCFGLYQIIVIYPVLLDVITILGTALLVWIGFNILRAEGANIQTENLDEANIPTFMQGALMQWLNPKAWIAAVAGTALFSASKNSYALAMFVLIYFVVCYFSLWIWGVVGEKLADFLNVGKRTRIFNMLMGVLLIVISIEMCWTHFYP